MAMPAAQPETDSRQPRRSGCGIAIIVIASSVLIIVSIGRAALTPASYSNDTPPNFRVVLNDAHGRVFNVSGLTLRELSPKSAPLASTTVQIPSGFDHPEDTLTVDTHRHVIVFAAKQGTCSRGSWGFCVPPIIAEQIAVHSWTGRLLRTINLKGNAFCDSMDALDGLPIASLVADSHDAIYLTCFTQVLKLSPDLNRIQRWGYTRFKQPVSLGIDGRDNLYVLDNEGRLNHPPLSWGFFADPEYIPYVTKLSPAGRVLARWQALWRLPSTLTFYDVMAVSPSGHVFISDYYANLPFQGLQAGAYREFSPLGRPLGPWRKERTSKPWANLAADASGNLYANGQARPIHAAARSHFAIAPTVTAWTP